MAQKHKTFSWLKRHPNYGGSQYYALLDIAYRREHPESPTADVANA